MSAKTGLLGLLALVAAGFLVFWIAAERRIARPRPERRGRPSAVHLGIGALTDFLDTLGVGSFATTTSLFRLSRTVRDEQIPGTMNVGHTFPTFAEAFIYVAVIQVEMKTLVVLIAAAVAGAFLGAGVVSRWPRRKIQIGMGALMFVAAAIIVLRQVSLLPGGGQALGVEGGRLIAGVFGNFLLGALMTLGIGLYAPCMILVSLLGMNPQAAFPIMMGSCAFLMPVAGLRFIRSQRYDLRAALGLTLGGVPGVLIAAFIVKSLSLRLVHWLVVVVVVYTATALLRAAVRQDAETNARQQNHTPNTAG